MSFHWPESWEDELMEIKLKSKYDTHFDPEAPTCPTKVTVDVGFPNDLYVSKVMENILKCHQVKALHFKSGVKLHGMWLDETLTQFGTSTIQVFSARTDSAKGIFRSSRDPIERRVEFLKCVLAAPCLTHLNVGDLGFSEGDKVAAAIGMHVPLAPSCANLVTFELSGCDFKTKEDGVALGKALSAMTSLVRFEAKFCNMGAEGFIEMCMGVVSPLVHFNADGNYIAAEAFEALAEMPFVAGLKHLSLWRCLPYEPYNCMAEPVVVDPEGERKAAATARIVTAAPGLRTLIVGQSIRTGEHAVTVLEACLAGEQHGSWEIVDVSMAKEHVCPKPQLLADMVTGNPDLVDFVINDLLMDEGTEQALCDAVLAHHRLRKMYAAMKDSDLKGKIRDRLKHNSN